MKKSKLAVLISTILCVSMFMSTSIFASEGDGGSSTEYTGEAMYSYMEQLDDPKLLEYNLQLEEQGFELEKISVKYESLLTRRGTSDYTTTLTHKQPTRTKKVYNENIYNSINDFDSLIEQVVGSIKYSWIATDLFNISVESISNYFSKGWIEFETNDTLHTKVAYIYDDERGKHFWGAQASRLNNTGSIESVQYDNSNDAFTKTKNINVKLDSENYTNDSELLRLGRIYYKELVTYSEYWHDVEANLSVRLSA